MNRSTFEIISKYISSKNHAKISFDGKGDGACTDMETGEIHLPDSVGDKNVFAILALLMHESAHVGYSKEPLEKCVDKGDDIGQHIFNVIEDFRLDSQNFNRLPNIKGFYERLIKDYCDYSQNTEDIEFQVKVLITALLNMEGFHKYGFKQDPAVQEFLADNPIENLIHNGSYNIINKNWGAARKDIQDIKNLLKMAQKKHPPQGGQGQGQGSKGLGDIEKMIRPHGKVLSDAGSKLKGGSNSQIGEIALEENTAQQFKELLNIKERKVTEDGSILDTDNLITYFTHDLEELFKDDSYIKRKKSKILFLLDASGSMTHPLLDNKRRIDVVARCAERMVRILKEVQEVEGINIEWEISMFSDHFEMVQNKNNWQKEYYPRGGTNLAGAFEEAIKYFEKDPTVDGKKMIIVLTDGEVTLVQIESMKKSIIKNNTDIKTIIIGIGTDPTGPMALKILGDNLILAEESANIVILNTIKEML